MERPPRTSVEMSTSFKEPVRGVCRDDIPMQFSIPFVDIFPSQHERMLLKSSAKFRKKNNFPRLSELNPACIERQITDAYETKRINRNPALYRPTKADTLRSFSVCQAAENRVRDIGSLHLDPENIPNFDTYNKASFNGTGNHQPTYGQKHHARVYNPLAHDLIKKSTSLVKRSANQRLSPGLSLAELQALLAPFETQQIKANVAPDGYQINIAKDRPSWNSCPQFQSNRPQHPGTSILGREEALSEPLSDKIIIGRKKAAGAHISGLCLERQNLDVHDVFLRSHGLTRQQQPLLDELSPRHEYQRAVIRNLIKDRRRCDVAIEERLDEHRRRESLARIIPEGDGYFSNSNSN